MCACKRIARRWVAAAQVLENCFRRRSAVIAECQAHMLRQPAHEILRIIQPLMMTLRATKRADASQVPPPRHWHLSVGGYHVGAQAEALFAMQLMEMMLQSTESFSAARRAVLHVASRIALMFGVGQKARVCARATAAARR